MGAPCTVWCKEPHLGAWPPASVGLGNASCAATPSASHPAWPRSAAWEWAPGTRHHALNRRHHAPGTMH